jgi:putative transposase
LPVSDTTPERPLPTIWELPDELWERIEPILERRYPPAPTGRPRAGLRLVLDAVIHRMRSGCQWNQMPERFGPSSTVHAWFQRLAADGALREVWAAVASEREELGAVLWEWQAADGVMGKSRFEGEARGPNPTDRGKMGTKKHLLVEQGGGPLGLVVDGANVNDHKLLQATIEAIVIERPDPEERLQRLCLDKAYDNRPTQEVCARWGYVPHIRRIGEEKLDRHARKTHPARRWVVERTIAWLQKCRAILIRYDKKAENYEGLVQLACALLWFRRLERLKRRQRVFG